MIVKQAANVLDILEFFARAQRPATLSEIAQEFGWPRSSTFNMVGTLVERGFLYEPRPRAGYYPTPRWLSLARGISEAEPLPPSLHRLLLDVVKETGETCYVAAPAGDRVVFLDVVESDSPIRYFAEIGKRLPIHATATGKAILAQYSPAERRSVLGKIKFERYQPNTPMSIAAVEAEIAAGLAQGWFLGATQFTSDVMGLSVMLPLSGRPLSISIGGPNFRMEKRMADLGTLLRDAARSYADEQTAT
jgi:IclR family transcriptional regulator, acetate operon repressor